MGLASRIIPCLDIDNGRVVKGVNFSNMKDAGDPVEIAKKYNDNGADEIILLDITATLNSAPVSMDIVTKVANEIDIPLTVGGGVSSFSDFLLLLNAGADKVCINSAAIKNPNLINNCAEHFGSQCVVVAVDVKRHNDGWHVYDEAGKHDTGIDAISWLKIIENRGAGEILLTSIDFDGTMNGYDLELLQAAGEATNVPLIASGGAGKPEHLYSALKNGKSNAVLVASIFHDGIYNISQVKKYLIERGLEIRLQRCYG